jgi:hypothetical protein
MAKLLKIILPLNYFAFFLFAACRLLFNSLAPNGFAFLNALNGYNHQ